VAGAGGPIERLVKEGHLVLAVDLRGSGETQDPGVTRYANIAHYIGQEWRDLYIAYLLGTSYLKMRAEDVLVCARLAAAYESDGKPGAVHLVSIGRCGPPALHAVALEPERFASATLRNSLVSWSHVVRTPRARNQFINVVHGALEVYDLPDLVAALPEGKVTLVQPFDALEQPVEAN
jgi:hypothetical protein